VNDILDILVDFGAIDFGGGKGGEPSATVVRFLLAAFFWLVLALMAGGEWRRGKDRKDLYILLAAWTGALREVLMFLAEYGGYRGWFSFAALYRIYPPLEHAATMLSGIFICYAFMSYGARGEKYRNNFIAVATFITLVIYAVTAVGWPAYLAVHQPAEFAMYGGDLAFRVAASLILGFALTGFVIDKNRGTRISISLIIGIGFLLLDELLMIINIATLGRNVVVFAPVRHNLHIWAIPFFIATYWAALAGARKAAMAALRASEDRFRTVADFTVAMEYWVLPDGSLAYMSPSCEHLTGYTAAEFLHAPELLARIVHPEDRHLFESHVHGASETSAGAAPCNLIFRIHTRRGEERWIGHVCQPVVDRDGTFQGRRASNRDLTERKEVEAALRESEERFRNLLRDVPGVAVQGYGPDGTTTYWNEASEALYGYTAHEAVGRNLLDLVVPPEMREGVRQAIRHMAETGQHIPASELSLMRRDGSRVAVFSSHVVVQIPGRAAELFCLDIDISERQRAEAALRESEERFRAYVEQAADAVFVHDETGRFVDVNERACESLGYSRAELLQRGVLDVETERSSTDLQASWEHMTPGQRRTEQGRHRRKDGSTFPVEVTFGELDLKGQRFCLCLARDTTERQHAEERARQAAVVLQESERLQRLALQIGRIGTVEMNLTTPRARWSSEWAAIWGLPEEFTGDVQSFCWARIHPDDLGWVQAQYAQQLQDREERGMEFRIVRPDGELRWVSSREQVITEGDADPRSGPGDKGGVADATGVVTRIVGVVQDITERKRAEAALRESEAKLRSVIDCSPVPLAINDAQGNITYVNREFTKTFGYELGDIPTLADWWHKAYPDPAYQDLVKTQWQRRLNKALQEGMPFESAEVHIRCKDGAQRIVLVGVATLTGTFAATHLVVLYDITERQRAEAALRESEDRFRAVVEGAAMPVFVTVEMKFSYLNPAALQLLGATTPDQVLGQPILSRIHPDCHAGIQARAVKVFQGQRGVAPPQAEVYLKLDGTPVPVEATASPITYQGQPAAVVFLQDITERKRLEAANTLLAAQFRQAQKLEAIGQLAGGIAHDFNNILAVILGNAELMVADIDPSHPARASLEEIQQASYRAKDLVRQILTYSRQQTQDRHVIALEPIIAEATKFLHATIPSGVEIVLALAAGVPPVLGDATQIQQVIFNLCTNAWHAFEDQPGRISIQLQAVTLDAAAAELLGGLRPGCFVCLSVSDTGKGMDAALIEHIFNPFFTTKAAGKGTGLGLSVVQGIVAAHDGAITVVSQPGQGTTFRVYFPAADVGTADAGIASATSAPQGQGQHVLFLDDEEALVRLATRMLERLGYRVTGFTQAAEAVQAFRADPGQFDVVITDLNMPGSSGMIVAREILAVRPDLPVLLCSGHLTEKMKTQARSAGIRHVLYKPHTMEEFSARLHQLVSEPRQS